MLERMSSHQETHPPREWSGVSLRLIMVMTSLFALLCVTASTGAALHVQMAWTSPMRSTIAARAAVSMAGFGGSSAAGKKGKKKKSAPSKAPLSPRSQWDRYREHRDEDFPTTTVFARVRETEGWFEVGDVTSAAGDLEGAVQAQKRLILEHAVRVRVDLSAKARDLECGYEISGTVKACAKAEAAEAGTCGFQGRADLTGRYGKTEGDISNREPASLRTATGSGGPTNMADSKGRW